MRQERREQAEWIELARSGSQGGMKTVSDRTKRFCGSCKDMKADLLLWPKPHPLCRPKIRAIGGECTSDLYPPKENPND